jgi:4-cresol dehydrogenase (hydroxylating)
MPMSNAVDSEPRNCARITPKRTQLDSAVRLWTELLGSERVRCDDAARDSYSRSTQPRGTRPAAVLFPENTTEVQAIVRIAGACTVPLYPISRGNNWGYGDACAVTDGQVIVDLRRMNRILEVSAKLAYAVVEPGVTQQQMYEYLRDNNLPLWLDVTGAGPDASIVGNTLERGFGHSPTGDHFHMSAGYEIVMADGNLLHTGFGHFEQSQVAHVFKPGIGPALDGLFTQSNLGIVTRMGVWLNRKPEYLQGFGVKTEREEDIAVIVDALRELRLNGIVQSTVHIANDLRGLSSRSHYPWAAMHGQAPLTPGLRAKLRQKSGLGAWNVLGGIYGTRATARGARAEIRKALRRVGRVHFFDEARLNCAESIGRLMAKVGLFPRLREMVAAVRPAFDLLQGIPRREHLFGAGWRAPETAVPNAGAAADLDPLNNRWGFLWLSPIVPASGEHALKFNALINPVYEQFGFEPLLTMTSITPRALCCVMTVAFDKDKPAEAERALKCYDALWERCMSAGYVPYRCGIRSMKKLATGSEHYWDVVREIKSALDPQGIIAPSRYLPEAAPPLAAPPIAAARATSAQRLGAFV